MLDHFYKVAAMDNGLKQTLADNLKRLLATRPGLPRLALAQQMGVADGTLGRIKYGNGNPNIETLVSIARYFRVEPWQLLTENLDPSAPPHLSSSSLNKHTNANKNAGDMKLQELIELFSLLGEPERTYLLNQARVYVEVSRRQSDDTKSA